MTTGLGREHPTASFPAITPFAPPREHVADRQLFVTVACLTGAELSGLSRLDWADVDFTAGRIRIPGTKNATRDRTIDLERYYGHLAPKNKSEAMARLPRFPALFPPETARSTPPHRVTPVCQPGGDSWRRWRSWRGCGADVPDEKSGRLRRETAAKHG